MKDKVTIEDKDAMRVIYESGREYAAQVGWRESPLSGEWAGDITLSEILPYAGISGNWHELDEWTQELICSEFESGFFDYFGEDN